MADDDHGRMCTICRSTWIVSITRVPVTQYTLVCPYTLTHPDVLKDRIVRAAKPQ